MEVHYLVLFLTIFWHDCNALTWSLAPNTQKCLKEELHANVLVAGEYVVVEVGGQRIDYIVRDSKGHILATKEHVSKGKFTFVTETYDTFEVCFISKVPPDHRGVPQDVTLDIKVGIEAKNYEGFAFDCPSGKATLLQKQLLQHMSNLDLENCVANCVYHVQEWARGFLEYKISSSITVIGEAAKLKPMELELKRLEDLSEAIVQDFTSMRKREEEMRDTNESTNNRVLFFSVFSMVCLLGLATWQVLYLRRYFKAKKLIE